MSSQIVHTDVKPENVLLTLPPGASGDSVSELDVCVCVFARAGWGGWGGRIVNSESVVGQEHTTIYYYTTFLAVYACVRACGHACAHLNILNICILNILNICISGTHIHMYICMYVIRVCVCVCVCVCVYIYIYIYISGYVCIYIYTSGLSSLSAQMHVYC